MNAEDGLAFNTFHDLGYHACAIIGQSLGIWNSRFVIWLTTSRDAGSRAKARFLVSVLLRQAWEPFSAECTRALRPQDILRLTEPIDSGVTNSPAFERMQVLINRMLWQAGYGFSVNGQTLDVSFMLPQLLRNAGYSDIQLAAYAYQFSARTSAWADIYHIAEITYKLGLANYVKTGIASQEEIEDLYDRMLAEMKQENFCSAYHFVSIIGIKP